MPEKAKQQNITMRDFYVQIEGLPEDVRATMCKQAIEHLCPISVQDLRTFQELWSPMKSFKEFIIGQNKLLKQCIEVEVSDFGNDVRKAAGLSRLTWETEL